MSDQIKNQLEPGEEVIWNAKPENFTVLDKTHKSVFIRKALIGAVIVLFLCIGYISLVAGKTDVKWIIFVIILGIYALIVLGDFLDAPKIKRISYYVTDSRILIENENVFSIPFETVKEYRFDRDKDGHDYLLIGDSVRKGRIGKMRTFSVSPVLMDLENGSCSRAVLYAVPQAEKLKKLLAEKIRLKA